MTLRRRLFFVLGVLPLWGGIAWSQGPELFTKPAEIVSEVRTKEPPLITRTGARHTAVVSAIERVKGAVVNIHSERNVAQTATEPFATASNRVNGMGTGIVIDPRGYIVTNQHVVDEVNVLRIRMQDGSTQNATIVARNPELDLALIKIEVTRPLPVMPFGTTADLMVGETVIAIGNAYGYEHTVSVGVVSALKRDVSLNKEMSYKSLIQTDACINPGNSGGPLINVNGELVGVNVAIRAGAQGIGFAIPVDHMVKAVSEMLRNRRRSSNLDGLAYRDVLEKGEDGLHRRVVVDRIEPGSPADLAGIKTGDFLVQLGDIKVHSSIDVERSFLERRVGDAIPVTLRRQDQEKNVEFALVSTERNIQPAAVGGDTVWTKLGVQLSPVAADQITKLNTQLHGGLEVTAVNTSGAAARSGIRKGDILVGLHQWETVNMDNVTFVLNHPEFTTFSPLSFFILRSGQVRRGQFVAP